VLWSNAFGLDNLLSCSLVPYVNGVSTSCLGVLLGLVLVVVFFVFWFVSGVAGSTLLF
jgi:hypothetical protein